MNAQESEIKKQWETPTINQYKISDFISARKACELYKNIHGTTLTHMTVWRLCKQNILISYKAAGRLMVLKSSIEEYSKRRSGPKPKSMTQL